MEQRNNARGVPRASLRRIVASAVAAVTAAACGDASPPSGPNAPSARSGAPSRSVAERPRVKYLPVGVPVPVGRAPDGIPNPRAPHRHVLLPQAEMARAGLLPATHPRAPKFRMPDAPGIDRTPRATPPPPVAEDGGHWEAGYSDGNSGIWLYQAQHGRGLYGGQQARLDIDPYGELGTTPGYYERTVYAPTHYPSGGSCIELATMHYSSPQGTLHDMGFYNWCAPTPGFRQYRMTAPGFQAKYLRPAGGTYQPNQLVSYFVIHAALPERTWSQGDCWYGELWNFETGQWDLLMQSCGVSKNAAGPYANHQDRGWTMWESKNVATREPCPNLKSVSVRDVWFWAPDPTIEDWAGWYGPAPEVFVRPGWPSRPRCWANGEYSFHWEPLSLPWSEQPLNWRANTPNIDP